MKSIARVLFLLPLLIASCARVGSVPSAPMVCADTGQANYAAPRRAAEEKPGIATKWGEEREDVVGHGTFDRESPRTPSGLATLYYNDEKGVEAMKRGSEAHFTIATRRTGNGLATFSLVDSRGKPLKAWELDGKLVCVGEKGERYQLEVRNNSNARLETVMTVDGLDVLDGQPGSFSKRGYIIEAGEVYRVQGFRISDNTVAAFRFSAVKDSYAQLLHKNTDNAGVAGLAIFTEKGTTPVAPRTGDIERLDANPFPRSSSGRYAKPPPAQ